MSKQLKGPWTAIPTGLSRSGLPEHEIHWSDQGECVAEIVHGEEAARLIASAPDLLELLEEALFLVRFIPSVHGNLCDRIKSAIAKAKGPQ